ncbi:protein CUSTOS [Brachyistius frenatus]|uniref:protein CUSTOS n=1 Tax=Brachyistius frenatus TaxID=100188 RepID=UPI0037E8A7E7
MAGPTREMVGVSGDSSSSDDEVLKRCQEAVWETETKDGDSKEKESKRVVVADHEHDGNELQVTQGFRTHVAKKLGYFLDSRFSEIKPETSSCVESAKSNDDDDDDDDQGFRLFSTSVPGQKAVESPAPVRRRPLPSSSDSDSEMETRLKEAAVSVRDLLPSLALPSTLSTPSTEPPCLEKIKKKKKKKKKVSEGKDSHVVKKENREESVEMDSAGCAPDAQSNGEHMKSEQEHMQIKVKRKKKKRRKGNEEEISLD